MQLVVTQAFGDHAAGDRITDADMVAALLASDRRPFVVSIADEQPAPDEAPAPEPAFAPPATPDEDQPAP